MVAGRAFVATCSHSLRTAVGDGEGLGTTVAPTTESIPGGVFGLPYEYVLH